MSWRVNLAPVLPRRQSPSDDITAKKLQDHKLQKFIFWELAVKEILPDLCDYVSCGYIWENKVNPSVMR